ncbi:hypothetical protein PV327_008073 [Microctonus hyperodae]|uniref:F-box domain-containing protein n=1 Tax=Microctonus hyperodae TaxID=165561 RepID=A0AA39F2C4_MICHY|nr:hypothetical protein PV327_008073 [Microctonus hyperodae]
MPVKQNFFQKLQNEIFTEIVSYLTFRDQCRLISASKYLASKICSLPRNIEITPQQCFGTTRVDVNRFERYISASSIIFVINPFGYGTDSKLRKIVIADMNVSNVSRIRIECMLLYYLNDPRHCVVEVDLSAIIIAPFIVSQMSVNCPRLKKLILGNTRGSCDRRLKQFFTDSIVKKSLKILEINNNNHFSGSALAHAQISILTHLTLKNCNKLHLRHLRTFIRNNKTLISLEITNCCDDERGPNMDIILNSLGCTMISRFVLMNDIAYSDQYISWEMMNRPTYALEELTIGGHRGLNPHILSCVIRNSPNLNCETLVLDDVMCLNCAIWFTKYQKLKSITYRGSCELSGCHLSMFVMINRETLQVFDVTGAEIITCLQCIAQLEIIDSPGNKPILIVINTERIEGALSMNPVIDVSHALVIFTDVAQKY